MAEVIDINSRSALGIQPKDGYTAFEPSGHVEPGLFLVFRDREQYLILRYAELESIGPVAGIPANDAVVLRFAGSAVRDVRIEGRRLLDLVRHLRWHRVARLSETPEGWDCGADDGSITVIHRIKVTLITP